MDNAVLFYSEPKIRVEQESRSLRMGKRVFRIGSYAIIVAAVAWSLLAIGNGKVGELFGVRVFMAAAEDMMLALALNGASAVCLVALGILALTDRRRA
jgi:uncharacterized membrane protein